MTARKAQLMTLGYTYELSKRTTVHAFAGYASNYTLDNQFDPGNSPHHPLRHGRDAPFLMPGGRSSGRPLQSASSGPMPGAGPAFPAVFRMACMDSLEWLVPWEFSPTLVASFIVAIVLFVRGQRVHHVTLARQVYFWSGMVLLYLSMHTRLDYYAERMFFIHRAQHLVLHHLGPLLVMAAFPGQVMRAGLPMAWRLRLRDFLRTGTGRATVAVLTNKIFVPALFVFLVLVWLLPSVQFYSMLDWRLYRLMNWSVVISGFMY